MFLGAVTENISHRRPLSPLRSYESETEKHRLRPHLQLCRLGVSPYCLSDTNCCVSQLQHKDSSCARVQGETSYALPDTHARQVRLSARQVINGPLSRHTDRQSPPSKTQGDVEDKVDHAVIECTNMKRERDPHNLLVHVRPLATT